MATHPFIRSPRVPPPPHAVVDGDDVLLLPKQVIATPGPQRP